jgi:hypothetical protein
MRRRELQRRQSRTGNHPELARIIEAAQQIDARDARGMAAFRAIAMAVAETLLARRASPLIAQERAPNRGCSHLREPIRCA